MMEDDSLTAGIIAKLCSGTYNNEEFLVQVVACKNVNGRYRVLLHDGVHQSSNAMLNSTYNPTVEAGEIKPNSILRVSRCNVTESNNSKFFAVLIEVEVVAQPNDKIGDPVKWEPGMTYAPPGGAANRNNAAPPPAASAPPARNGDYGPTRAVNNADVKPPPPQQQPQQQQRPPFRNNNNNNSSSSSNANSSMNTSATQANVQPISGLNPYQNKWVIKGRVIQKSDKRSWKNARGEGTLFSFEIQDDSATLKVTAFKEECEKFYAIIEEGTVILISKGALKPKDTRYNKTTSQYELTVQRETTIEVVPDDGDLPMVKFDFKTIADIENIEVGEILDVVGVVKSLGDVNTIVTKKDSRELTKRDLQIVDDTKKIISMTLWGQQAKDFPSDTGRTQVLAARGVRVGDFNGKNLSSVGSTKLYIDDPDVEDINRLRGWWESEGSQADDLKAIATTGTRSMGSNWKCFKQTTVENMGGGEKPDYYSVKATVVFTKKDNSLYQACTQEKCNKKVQENGSGRWRCEKCAKELDDFQWRMMLQVNLADSSDNCWATLFQESGEVLLGVSAVELGKMKEEKPLEYDNIFAEVNFKPYLFRMRAKQETYNDETRLKTTVYEAKKFDPVQYGNVLSQQIDELAEKLAI